MARLLVSLAVLCFLGLTHGLIQMPMMKKYQNNSLLRAENLSNVTHSGTTYLYGAINSTFDYYSAIALGSNDQVFLVTIDTGSASLAVPSKGCVQESTSFQSTGEDCDHADNFYDASESSASNELSCKQTTCTCGEDNACAFQLAYGDGSFLMGTLVSDDFTLAGLSTTVVFGQIEAESVGFGGTTVDGILGMAYHALDPMNGDAVFDKLVQNGVCNNSFSMCMGYNGGMLTLGGVDETYSAGEMVFTPITNQSYYVVDMQDMLIGGSSIGLSPYVYNNPFTIVDSGTTLLAVPSQVMNAITDMFITQYCPNFPAPLQALCTPNSQGYSIFSGGVCWSIPDSEIELFPNISIVLNGTGPLSIPPQRYFLNVQGGWCFGIMEIEGFGVILGDVFMSGYNVWFDRANDRIGFAPVANCDAFEVKANMVSGDNQVAKLSESVEQPLVINVTYPNGLPAIGYQINFTGDGVKFESETAITNELGVAQNTPKITKSGTHTVTATVVGFESESITFTVVGKGRPLVFYIGIAGGAVGALVIIVIIALLIRRSRKHAHKKHHHGEPLLHDHDHH